MNDHLGNVRAVSGALGEAGQIYNDINSGVSGYIGSGSETTLPAAYLQYIVFDTNRNPTGQKGFFRVSTASNMTKAKVSMPQITIEQPGFIYIFVYNRSNSSNWVYFDELLVTHVHSSVVAGADYYPFGLVMNGREITDEPYRWGYQGQYAQENDSTGWNEFQLRMYDARFGRWLSPDPYGQFASPYLGMGNAPNMGVDPDGGMNIKPPIPTILREVVVTGSRTGSSLLGAMGSLLGGLGRMSFALTSWYVPEGTTGYTNQATWFDEDPGKGWELVSEDPDYLFNNFDYSNSLPWNESAPVVWGTRPDPNALGKMGANLISGMLLTFAGGQLLQGTVPALSRAAVFVSTEASAISTYTYIAANAKLTGWAAGISAGLAKPAMELLKSPRVRWLRIHHPWSRTVVRNAQETAENFSILPSRGTPFIPLERPPGWGHLLDLYQTTPNH